MLSKGLHQDQAYFLWLFKYLEHLLTNIYELVSLNPNLDGYHDVYGYMCGESVIPGPKLLPRTLQPQPHTAH